MDVLCVGMYRSCSTWQYEVAAHLVEKHRSGLRLGYLTGPQYEARTREEVDDAACCRVLKSHEGHWRFAQALAKGKAVALYSFRDVREVIYSMLHKRGVSFAEFLDQGMIHQLLANDRHWSAQPGVLTQRYEDLVTDPMRGVEEIARHLGVSLAEGEAACVAEAYSPQANRKRIALLGRKLENDGVDLADPSNAQLYDSTTLLHWNHMRAEHAPSWRDLAGRFEREALDRLCSAWLIERGYEPDRSWASHSTSRGPQATRPVERLQVKARTEGRLALGWLACQLRCATLRHPQTVSAVKSLFPLAPQPTPLHTARPYPPTTQVEAA